ncbi:tetratricopeptide repeat protein [bacterium]|nr:tetratricopeptide repeat protein [bacterium]
MHTRHFVHLIAIAALCPSLIGCQTAARQTAQRQSESSAAASDFATKFNLAKLREQEGDYAAARKLYKELLLSDPSHASTHHRLGIVEIRLGETDSGLDHLRLADAASPDNVAILNDLGFACLTTGRPEMAQQVLLTALDLDPHNERTINNLAMAYGLTGQFDKAFATFRRKLNEAEALSNLGYVATQAGNAKFATECYSRALSLNPNLKEAAEALAQLADLKRQIEQQKSIAAATKLSGAAEAENESAIRLTGAQQPQPDSRP